MVLGDSLEMLREMRDHNYEVKLSFSDGREPEGNYSEFQFATKEDREKASREGRLYEMDATLHFAFGW